MIDRTLLTEALAYLQPLPSEAYVDSKYQASYRIVTDAARLLLDFPTDQQVEEGWKAWQADVDRMVYRHEEYEDEAWPLERMRKVLERVGGTMISDDPATVNRRG